MVLQVCASEVQAVCAPARSLWPTLASAASSLALFVAANWGMGELLIMKGFGERLLSHAVVAFGMPLFPLLLGFLNALRVWSVKQRIKKRAEGPNDDRLRTIAILAICPLFIEVPVAISKNDELLTRRGYELIDDAHDFYPLELAPLIKALGGPNDQRPQDSAAHDNHKKLYIKFPETISADLELKERELLLTLGLAPEYSQLRYVRSRSRFQAVVTGLQAGGYVLSVVQRLVQHLAVCPLEALLCFLSVIVILQLLLELYACSHYQRPILIRFNHHQFAKFWEAPREYDTTKSFFERFEYIVYTVVGGLLVMLFSALSIYYSAHYMHSCRVCSVGALLFLFALLSWATGFILNSKWQSVGAIIMCFSVAIFLSSMVIAVFSTAKHWDLYHSPTINSFTWILPHVSSQT